MGNAESDKRRKRATRRQKTVDAHTNTRRWVTLSWEEGGPTYVDLGFCDALEAAQRASVFGQIEYERAVGAFLDESDE